MEDFIERSNALLTARPNSTRVSTRYTHKKVAEGGDRVDPTAKPAKIVIKTYDPKSGLVYKYKVKKVNELSRILASLGPQYFEFGADRKRGSASVMSGVEPEEPAAPEPQHAKAPVQGNDSHKEQEEAAQRALAKSKKNKKKSKK